jgi:prolyl oligopeptidase
MEMMGTPAFTIQRLDAQAIRPFLLLMQPGERRRMWEERHAPTQIVLGASLLGQPAGVAVGVVSGASAALTDLYVLPAYRTAQREDECLLYNPEQPDWYYQPHISPDGSWLAVSVLSSGAANLLFVGRTDGPLTALIAQFVGRYDVLHWRSDAIVLRAVEAGARNGRLIALHLPDGKRSTLLPEGDLPLLDAVPWGDGWIAGYLNAGYAELHRLDARGDFCEQIPLPGRGTVDWISVDPSDERLRFAYSDYARPQAVYGWQPGEAVCRPENALNVPFDPADFLTRSHIVASADGTGVPIFLAHRRDVAPTNCPTILCAYGGMGVALTPRFSADLLVWMEQGGVVVSVCARGGGELGAQWHQDAVGVHKQRTFDDVLAAVCWLQAEGLTTPWRLGLWGVSNGGLTAGVCLTQQPERFGTVVIESGLLDMLDYHRLGRGADWLAEYGDPNDPQQRAALRAYSPLHTIQPGRYPATLITTSDHDPRVGAAHSLRFAQRLQAAQSGPAPICLRVDAGGGHGDLLDRAEWLERASERLAFFAVHLGLEWR